LTRAQVKEDPRQVQPGVLTFDTRKTTLQDQAGLTFAHRLESGARLEATAYYGERTVEQFLSIPPAAPGSGGVVDIGRNYGGGALRYSQKGALLDRPFTLSTGAEYDRMEDRRKGFENDNGVSGALRRDESNLAHTTGLYVQAEWKFAERWSADAGVRRTTVRFENSDFFRSNGDNSGERAYSATTPVAGLVFKLAPRTSLYANFGKGFETPTFLEIANSNAGDGLNFDLKPSTSRHAEVGAKTIVPGWLRADVALFRIVTRDEIVVDTNSGGRATFKNVGHTDRNGVELGAETALRGPLQARLAYTWLDASYRESFDTVIRNGGAAPVNVAAGSMIPGVPRNLLYAELRYRREPFFAQLESLSKSRVAVNDPNLEFAGGYTVLNLAAGLVQEQEGGRWKLTEFVRVENLADRSYVGSVIVNEGNGRYYEPSPKRSLAIGAQASLSF
ncbi:MAG TPA: TonB-dependent receptor, partial [Burkholderiales bacterium]|nr:TonB-dependent receptor [Burkholderiales bacterium]